jgi:hypothetical protein
MMSVVFMFSLLFEDAVISSDRTLFTNVLAVLTAIIIEDGLFFVSYFQATGTIIELAIDQNSEEL